MYPIANAKRLALRALMQRLKFRATGQLRQPLLITENDVLVGEAPVRGVANIEDLGSLGINECPRLEPR